MGEPNPLIRPSTHLQNLVSPTPRRTQSPVNACPVSCSPSRRLLTESPPKSPARRGASNLLAAPKSSEQSTAVPLSSQDGSSVVHHAQTSSCSNFLSNASQQSSASYMMPADEGENILERVATTLLASPQHPNNEDDKEEKKSNVPSIDCSEEKPFVSSLSLFLSASVIPIEQRKSCHPTFEKNSQLFIPSSISSISPKKKSAASMGVASLSPPRTFNLKQRLESNQLQVEKKDVDPALVKSLFS
eukprot:GDKK01023705.1.p1 GENE.GDKK01023705.1~~GDKK01023705.1.p1  ORF type:complete len:245 (+),score=62.45 GDKK01023705.1:1-735(+)